MAHIIEPGDSREISCETPTTLLAINQTNSSVPSNSLFVQAPKYSDRSFHTHNSGSGYPHVPEYDLEKDICAYERGEYVRLHYEPYPDHIDRRALYLDRVTDASVTHPSGYETMGENHIPVLCPLCGRDAMAVVTESKHESKFTDIAYNTDADVCDVPAERLAWFDLDSDCRYIH